MIRPAPMGSILSPSDPDSDSTKDTTFIQFFDVREPKIHELWCLVLDRLLCEVYPTAQVEVPTGTVREFVTYYRAENGCRIHIIGKISINNSVQFLNVPVKAWRHGLPLIINLKDPYEATWWGSGKYYNQEQGLSMFDANSITHVV